MHGHTLRLRELGIRTRPVPQAPAAAAGDGGHRPVRCDAADRVVPGVRDDHVPLGIQRHPPRAVEEGAPGGAVHEPGNAGALVPRAPGEGGDLHACEARDLVGDRQREGVRGKRARAQVDRADDVVALISHDERAIVRDGDRTRQAEHCLNPRPVGVTLRAGARHGAQLAITPQFDDLMPASVRDVDGAVPRHRKTDRRRERPPTSQRTIAIERGYHAGGVDLADGGDKALVDDRRVVDDVHVASEVDVNREQVERTPLVAWDRLRSQAYRSPRMSRPCPMVRDAESACSTR